MDILCSHGILVNGTCMCNDGWSGKSDILDFDGFDCQTPVLLEQVLWGLVVFATVPLVVVGFNAFRSQYPVFLRKKESVARKGGSLKWFQYHPYQNLFFSSLSIPFIILMSFPKMISIDHRVIGRDWLPSIAFAVVVPLGFFNNISVELRTFDAMTGSLAANKDKIQALRKRMSSMYWFATAAYSIITVVVVLGGCFVSTNDPRSGIMQSALVVRNLSVAMYMFWSYRINKMVNHEVEELFAKLSSSQGNSRNSQSTAKLEKFLAFTKNSAEGKKKATAVAGGIYLLFLIPIFWPHQQVCIAITAFLSATAKGHPLRIYTVRGEKAEKSNKISPDQESSSRMEQTMSSNASELE